MSGSPSWGDDLGIVRGLGLIPLGSEGALSTVLTQIAALLPVGGRCLRAGLVGVLALSFASRLLFALYRDLLDRRRSFALNPLLALLGTQLWALSPAVQREALRVGSLSVSLALLALGIWLVAEAGRSRDARALPLAGILLGLTAGENHAAALLLLAVLLSEWLLSSASGDAQVEDRLGPASRVRFVALFLAAWGVCWLVPWLRQSAAHLPIDLGTGGLPEAPSTFRSLVGSRSADPERSRWLLDFWTDRVGLPLLGLAVGGALSSLPHAASRRAATPWWTLAGLGSVGVLLFAASGTDGVLLGLVASLGLSAFVPLALQASVSWLWTRPVPFARPAGVLAVSFALTLLLQRIDSVPASGAPPELGTQLWTETALSGLPPRSVILVRDPNLVLRLLAAQVLGAERTDVLSVPLAFLSRGTLDTRLLRLEPRLAPFLRQRIVNGEPDEYSLGQLADRRPVFVEFDPSWDARLIEHLRPGPLWLGFAPSAIGQSDRHAGTEQSQAALARLLGDAELDGNLDPVTRGVLGRQLGEQALSLALLGDAAEAAELVVVTERVRPGDPLAKELAARLEHSDRRHIAINDLFE